MSEKLISLFDYLGYPAGNQLGKAVAEYATSVKAIHSTRHVSNAKYTGPVQLYTREFLDHYFKGIEPKEDYTEINTQLMEDSFKIQEEENQNRIF